MKTYLLPAAKARPPGDLNDPQDGEDAVADGDFPVLVRRPDFLGIQAGNAANQETKQQSSEHNTITVECQK
ncbi:MAG: hypothetical protein EON54_25015 [Alcaligenaceae bacterium]|nr:MAG: hypothetical protein EON54_25015 [Alcaligenaceae bacterium]